MDVQKCPLTNTEKHSMIAEAAFLRSRNRDYPGDPVADWLGAEAEIDAALAAFCRSPHKDQEFSAYQRFRAEVRRVLEKAEETINAETIRQALDKVNGRFRQLGEFVPETIEEASKAVKQEIADAIEKSGYTWENLRIKQGELFASWKDKSIHTLNQKSKMFYDWLSHWRSKGSKNK